MHFYSKISSKLLYLFYFQNSSNTNFNKGNNLEYHFFNLKTIVLIYNQFILMLISNQI